MGLEGLTLRQMGFLAFVANSNEYLNLLLLQTSTWHNVQLIELLVVLSAFEYTTYAQRYPLIWPW